MDPLQLLREWTVDGKLQHIKMNGNRVEFGDKYSFERDMPTTYRSEKAKGPYYAVDALLTFLRERSTPFPEYVRKAKVVGVRTVSYLDRKDVEAYLTGKTSSSEYLQLSAPELEFAELPPLGDPHALPEDASLEPAAKRARMASGPTSETMGVDASSGGGPQSSSVAVSSESFMATVARGERRLRDRNSVLIVPNKHFASVLQLAKNKLAELSRSSGAAQQRRPVAIPVKPSGRTERSGPDTTLRDMGFADINIQTYGPGAATAPVVNGALPPPPGEPSRQPQPAPIRRPSSSSHDSRPPPPKNNRSGSTSAPGGTPIIIVPKGFDTKINMFNAKAFLQDGQFQSWEEAQALGVRKSSKESFMRTIGRSKPVAYQVTDTAPHGGDSTWRRVVAVFVQGKDWQFRGWPFKGASSGDMVDSFSRMLAVHLVAANESVAPSVRSWNCKIMKLHPTDRHGDMQLARDFYGYLDALMGARKSTLAY